MNLVELFSGACAALRAKQVRFAVAGGFAAVLYRAEDRLTNDIDLLIFAYDKEIEIAEEILHALQLDKVQTARIAELEGGPLFAIKSGSTAPAVLIGRNSKMTAGPGVDFILPTVPWVRAALDRAEDNLVDFGFGPVPTMTVEDVIIAKLYALKGTNRPKDADDLLSIFATGRALDMSYLYSQMLLLKVALPRTLRDNAPKLLQTVSKDVERKLGRKEKS